MTQAAAAHRRLDQRFADALPGEGVPGDGRALVAPVTAYWKPGP